MGRKGSAHVAVEGVKHYQSKGRAYVYDRETGTRIKAPFGTPEFLAELAELRARSHSEHLPDGSLGDIILKYKKFGPWDTLKPKTRLSYERAFAILQPMRRVKMSAMTRAEILRLRDEEYKPKFGRWMANYIVTVLGILFGFALDRGKITANPLEKRVKRIRSAFDAPIANRPWAPEECEAVLAAAPPQLLVPIALAMFSGLRKADVLSAKMSDIKNGEIAIRTSKRGVPVMSPMHAKLIAAIARRPTRPAKGKIAEKWKDAEEIAITSRGEAWTESGFNASWIKFKGKLEKEGKVKPGLTPHGLRHTLGTRLKEAGMDDGTIADVLAQRTVSQARHYSESAGLPDSAKAMVLGIDVTKKRLDKERED